MAALPGANRERQPFSIKAGAGLKSRGKGNKKRLTDRIKSFFG
jgi:hypothetical protein